MKSFLSIYFFGLAVIIAGCNLSNAGQSKHTPAGNDTSSIADKYSLEVAFPNLKFDDPVELTSPNDNTNRIFVIEQKGVIRVFSNKAD